MKRPLLVLGTTEFSAEVADVATASGWEVVGFVANMERPKTGPVDDLPVHWIDDTADMARDHMVICGLGTTTRGRFITQARELGFEFATVVHPAAVVSARATLGRGVIVGPGSVIAAYASIGDYVLVNRGALIGHHTSIGECCTIGPGSNTAGSCRLEDHVYIGMSAVVLDHLNIGARSIVAGGAVVTRDVPSRVMVAGVPATIRKEGIEGR